MAAERDATRPTEPTVHECPTPPDAVCDEDQYEDNDQDHTAWPRERTHRFADAAAQGAAHVPSTFELAEALFQTTHALKYSGKQWCDHSEPLARAISMPQARLLAELWDAHGTLCMTDVAQALGVTPRNVTTIVDGLEHKGLVRRQRDQHDRRAILLELTEQGHEHIARINTLHHTIGERFFAPLDTEERCLLWRLLTKLHAGFSAFSLDRA